MRPLPWLAAVLLTMAVFASACSGASDRLQVIVDTDMGFDDVRALLLLLESDEVDVVAVTVAGNGLARCPQAGRNARAILNRYELADVPVACGSRGPLVGANLAPTAWRDVADALDGMQLESSSDVPENAPELIVETVTGADKPVTIVTLGPLTNLARALAIDPEMTANVEAVRVMGGAVDVGGNILDFENPVAEFNIWFDPVAAQQVFASNLDLTLVPLDATNDVPITPYLYDAFTAHAGTGTASSLIAGYVNANPFMGGIYHWDDLAVATLLDGSLVEYDERLLTVVVDGDDEGRTAETPDGAAIRVALSADREGFERLFYSSLAGTETPDVSPWEPNGRVTFDGEDCTYQGPDPLPVRLEVVVDNQSDVSPLGLLVVEYREGTTREQIQAFSESNPTGPPPFFTIQGIAPMPYRTSSVWSYQPTPESTLLCVVSTLEAIELAGVRIAS